MPTELEHGLDPDPESAPSETQEEQSPVNETEPLRESVDTVREMMDLWRQQYETAEGEAKQELAYRLVKMGESLVLSGFMRSK